MTLTPLAAALALPLTATPPLDVELVLTPEGGGVADEGSARAPLPQGMASPLPGWVLSEGGSRCPSVEAIPKRVVQRVVFEAGEVNW